ncbi:MAG: methyltransferase domain-containing protein [Bryobacteraceae bacterium]
MRGQEAHPSGSIRQRLFAWILTRCGRKLEPHLAQRKTQLLQSIAGAVLEIGPGTGANFPYFDRHRVQWIGIEPNPFMHPRLREQAAGVGIEIELRSGTAENIPAPDGSVDAVVSTLVLCSVTDPDRVLSEVRRVLKPGGKFVFIEHVAAPGGTVERRLQRWVRPLWRQLGDGCHPDRETADAIERSGFQEVSIERFTVPFPVVGPHIAGVAVKAG